MKRRKKEKKSGKKKKWILPVSIIGGVLLLFLVVIGAFLLRHCSGIYVRTSGGRNMVVFDDTGPVVLSTTDKPDRFDGIETGDRVIAVCGFVHDTYPAQSDAKFVLRLWKGDLEDIPQKDRDALWELGRLFENKDSAAEEKADFPDWGLTLLVRDVTPAGLTLVCTKRGGNPTGELTCGTDYRLLVSKKGKWEEVPTLPGNHIWDDLGYRISEEQDTEFLISWDWLYGKLPKGTYRLAKEFSIHRGPVDYEEATYWVEFEISE